MTDQPPDPGNWLEVDPDAMPAYLTGREPSRAELDYESVRDDVHRTANDLFEAPDDRIQAETDRLRRRAEQIEPGVWRDRALQSADGLRRLVRPCSVPTGPHLAEARSLQDAALDIQGTPAERIAAIRHAMNQIGELSRQAPMVEQGAILRLNSPLVRLIEQIQASAGR